MPEIGIKDIIKQELKLCAASPAYFMKKYCKIQHPERGTIPFALYEFQEKVLDEFAANDYNILLKSRQLGISTLCGGFALWLMIFHSDKNVLVVATKQDVAKTLVTKVRFMYDKLPSWIRKIAQEKPGEKGAKEDNKLSLRLGNGSQIQAISSTGDAGRSLSLSMLIIDEAAFIEEEKMVKLWGSAQQTLATGGRAIVLSTPNGSAGWFHQQWEKAEAGVGKKKMHAIKLPWYVHPEHDQQWRDDQEELLGKSMAAQECDCNFNTSGNTVIDVAVIDWMAATHVKEPIQKRGIDNGLWIWNVPDYAKNYIVCADVARGDGKDYSAFHVIEVESLTQVAEYNGQIGTTEYGHLLVNIATEYNDAVLVIENANIGWASVQVALDRNYKNLYYSIKEVDKYVSDTYLHRNLDLRSTDKMVPGFTTSTRSRPLIISKFEMNMRERACVIQSQRFCNQMKAFIWENGKAQARQGYNDDMVMAWCIGLWTRDTALKLRQQGLALTKSTFNHFSTGQKLPSASFSSLAYTSKPFVQRNQHGEDEDYRWVL